MHTKEVKELLEVIKQYPVDVLHIENSDFKLYYQKENAANASLNVTGANGKEQEWHSQKDQEKDWEAEEEPEAQQTDHTLHEVTSPMVGTFYVRSNLEAEPFVEVGSKIEKNQPVGILEAMKLQNEVKADVNGEVVDILVEEGQVIEYDQALMRVKVAGED